MMNKDLQDVLKYAEAQILWWAKHGTGDAAIRQIGWIEGFNAYQIIDIGGDGKDEAIAELHSIANRAIASIV